jgi:hypothetical protein
MDSAMVAMDLRVSLYVTGDDLRETSPDYQPACVQSRENISLVQYRYRAIICKDLFIIAKKARILTPWDNYLVDLAQEKPNLCFKQVGYISITSALNRWNVSLGGMIL